MTTPIDEALLPSDAELRAERIQSLLQHPGYEVFQTLIRDGINDARKLLFTSKDTQLVWKAVGQLEALERIIESMDFLIQVGEAKKDKRLKHIQSKETDR